MTATWENTTLGEVCEFKYGKSLAESKRAGGEVAVYGSNGVVGSHDTSITVGETIVIGRKGSFGEVNLSRVSCWPIDTTYFIDSTATEADLRWLYWRLQSMGLTKLNRAAAVPGLNREDAYRQPLLLPPLTEQRRIADILDRADALRAKRQAVIDKLDSLTQAIFHDMFGDVRTNDRGWPFQSLGAVSRVTTGRTPPGEVAAMYGGEVPFVTPGDLGSSSPVARTLSPIGVEEVRTVRSGAALVCCIGATIGKMDVANGPSGFNQQINAVEWYPEVDDVFGISALRCFASKIAFLGSSTTMPILKKSAFEKLGVPLPPLPLQREFRSHVEGIEALKASATNSEQHAGRLVASLQQRAFSGVL